MELSARLAAAGAGPGELVICWLGQAGFYLKDHEGTVFLIDPYFSNCGERIRGFKRLSAQLCGPEDIRPDYYCITHTPILTTMTWMQFPFSLRSRIASLPGRTAASQPWSGTAPPGNGCGG